MSEHALAALIVVVGWWLGTAAVMRLAWLRPWTYRWSLAGLSVLALAAFGGVAWSSRVESVSAAYVGFGCALVIWAWHELTFLLGLITGPRRASCPPDARGWTRFRLATATVIHHEVALALTVGGLLAFTWGAPNPVATWTFLVLWGMRLSAKLNLFWGVRHVTEEFVPERLRYLVTYFRRDRSSPLLPASIGVSAALTVAVGAGAWTATGAPARAGLSLVTVLLLLGWIEHLFLAFPLRDALLWRWVLRSERPPSGTSVNEDTPPVAATFGRTDGVLEGRGS
ncbi:MAG TPA: putative photosynthetic complex assembly protein PuhE [Sandaracinaceae bacterium LLY-WYZ-13_1]|nr:putative photosynthetic complex assembly protein PuhE [Sandaracinaceae bacterium LLY-WYZ-13_1]